MYVEMGGNLGPWLTLSLWLRLQPIISVSTSSLSGTGWLERDGGGNFPSPCHLHSDGNLEGWALLKDLLRREDPVENRMPLWQIYKTIIPERSKRVFFFSFILSVGTWKYTGHRLPYDWAITELYSSFSLSKIWCFQLEDSSLQSVPLIRFWYCA